MKSLAFVSKVSQRVAGAALSALMSQMLTGCGPELDPISRIETLRIVGVSKSAPYARPGESVDLRLLWEDGRQGPVPEVDTFFAFWCLNPPAGLFAECLRQPPASGREPQFIANSNTFTLEIPEDALRPSLIDPSLPQSGMAVVFYGVCAGRLDGAVVQDGGLNAEVLSGAADGEALIPRCLDDDGNELGPDDFVVGYSTILVYEELRNENPEITGFRVNGQDVAIDCIDEECDAPFEVPELDGCEGDVACLKACEDDGALFLCDQIEITALVDESSAEQDSYAQVAYGTEVQESIWVSYFIDRGNVSPPVKLVNDAARGWQEDYSSAIFAPKDPGPLRIWAAVRDNRGGISWVRLPAYVEE
jgi:hypothetical protein